MESVRLKEEDVRDRTKWKNDIRITIPATRNEKPGKA